MADCGQGRPEEVFAEFDAVSQFEGGATVELLAGTDPTRIPLVAMLVPLAAMAVTGFICLHVATARAQL